MQDSSRSSSLDNETKRGAAAGSASISANGLSSRCLRARSACTASGLAASPLWGNTPRLTSSTTYTASARLHGLWIGGIAGEMKAAEPLERNDLAGGEPDSRCLDGIAGAGQVQRQTGRIGQPRARPATWASVGLRVKAPVRGILVLSPAVLAHRKRRHRRQGPVIRH